MKNKNTKEFDSSPQFGKSFRKLNLFQKAALIILFILICIISFPIVLILIFGLLPTLTILFVDKKNYDKQLIVGCFNIAGVFFYLFGLLNKFSVGQQNDIADNIFMTILMLGSAALGLVLYNELPNFYAYLYRLISTRKIDKINTRLEKLKEDWGEEIVPNIPSSK